MNLSDFLIIFIQSTATIFAILAGMLSLSTYNFEVKQDTKWSKLFSRFFLFWGYFCFSYALLKYNSPIDQSIPYIDIVYGELIRMITPLSFVALQAYIYLRVKSNVMVDSEIYHGIDRRKHGA